jgi:hypothetical protein
MGFYDNWQNTSPPPLSYGNTRFEKTARFSYDGISVFGFCKIFTSLASRNSLIFKNKRESHKIFREFFCLDGEVSLERRGLFLRFAAV